LEGSRPHPCWSAAPTTRSERFSVMCLLRARHSGTGHQYFAATEKHQVVKSSVRSRAGIQKLPASGVSPPAFYMSISSALSTSCASDEGGVKFSDERRLFSGVTTLLSSATGERNGRNSNFLPHISLSESAAKSCRRKKTHRASKLYHA
jgi:hypothetical protein